MEELLIWARSPEDQVRVERALYELLGERVSAIEYVYPSHFGNTVVEVGDGLDIVPDSVAISLANALYVRIGWAMAGPLEGLSVSLNAPSSSLRPDGTERELPPSNSLSRRIALPQTVVGIGASWHEPDDKTVQALDAGGDLT